jgi:uncharacterized membrane protein YphA (DoxX/SURF4 family)
MTEREGINFVPVAEVRNSSQPGRAMNITLWVIQFLLAALFLFAGIMKLIMPIEAMNQGSPIQMPGMFLRFIGVAETLGGFGLVLPGLLGIKRMLTPLAAIGLIVIMIGAVGTTVKGAQNAAAAAGMSVVPFIVGALLVLIAYSRRSYFSA